MYLLWSIRISGGTYWSLGLVVVVSSMVGQEWLVQETTEDKLLSINDNLGPLSSQVAKQRSPMNCWPMHHGLGMAALGPGKGQWRWLACTGHHAQMATKNGPGLWPSLLMGHLAPLTIDRSSISTHPCNAHQWKPLPTWQFGPTSDERTT